MRTARAVAGLLLALAVAAAGDGPFTFAVLGDRAGGARPEVFKQIVAEIALLYPDLIVCTGDLVEGNAPDAAAANAQWDTVLGMLSSTGIPLHLAPGNHDVAGPASESAFERRIGRRWHSLKYGNSTFLFIDNSGWRSGESLPVVERRWLDKELENARQSRHSFVLMHRPYWRYALDKGLPELLHSKFKAAGVDYVFTGHDHFYCTTVWDGIRYFQVGPSGSRLKVYDDPGAGAFQNYLLCRVNGDSVAVEVRVPGRAKPLPVDTVTLTDIQALTDARRRAVKVEAVDLRRAGRDSTFEVRLRNVTARVLSGTLAWRDSLTDWRVSPRALSFTLAPDGRVADVFRFRLPHPDSVYPAPEFSLPYEYLPGRATDVGERLEVRRLATSARIFQRPGIDGRLDEACWRAAPTLTGFGAADGGPSPLARTDVWLGSDGSMLYVGAHCREAGGRRADDGDSLKLLLMPQSPLAEDDSPTYYQVTVTPLGSISDERCRARKGRDERDARWSGNWKAAARRAGDGWVVEMSCPLADLGATPGSYWGINACRYQAGSGQVAVWQAPFAYNPSDFGLLVPAK